MKPLQLYKGKKKYLSVLFVLGVGIGGYFFPLIGLLVVGLIALAIGLNIRRTRYFCGQVCPNGASLSAVLAPVFRKHKLPKFLYAPEFRRALCAFMLFCMVNLMVRFRVPLLKTNACDGRERPHIIHQYRFRRLLNRMPPIC